MSSVLTPAEFGLQFSLLDATGAAPPPATPSVVVTALPNDRWDLISWRVYGSIEQIALLISTNPTLVISATIPQGTVVYAPVLTAPQAAPSVQSLWPP